MAVHFDPHVTRAMHGVHPGVGIPRRGEDFLVLFEPRVEAVPVEGDMTFQRREVPAGICVGVSEVVVDSSTGVAPPAYGSEGSLRHRSCRGPTAPRSPPASRRRPPPQPPTR